MVTLEGQLIEASGTMAGGGKQVARGGMKASLSDTISADDMLAMEVRNLKTTLAQCLPEGGILMLG